MKRSLVIVGVIVSLVVLAFNIYAKLHWQKGTVDNWDAFVSHEAIREFDVATLAGLDVQGPIEWTIDNQGRMPRLYFSGHVSRRILQHQGYVGYEHETSVHIVGPFPLIGAKCYSISVPNDGHDHRYTIYYHGDNRVIVDFENVH